MQPAEQPILTLIQFSDAHVGNPANLPRHDRLAAAVELANARKPAFVIDTGDVASHPVYGAQAEYLAEFDGYLEHVARLAPPLYVVPGNHDIGYPEPAAPRADGTPWGDYRELVEAYRLRFAVLDQSFVHSGFRFVLVNNNPRTSKGPGHISAEQFDWIERELACGQTTFVFCHVEVLHEGVGEPWGPSSERLSALCRRHGVPAVAYGHRHEMHLTPLDGTLYVMCPDLKVPGHQAILEYRLFAGHFDLWSFDVLSGQGERLGRFDFARENHSDGKA